MPAYSLLVITLGIDAFGLIWIKVLLSNIYLNIFAVSFIQLRIKDHKLMMTRWYKARETIDSIGNRKLALAQAWRLINDFIAVQLVIIALVVQHLIPASCSIMDLSLDLPILLLLLAVTLNALLQSL